MTPSQLTGTVEELERETLTELQEVVRELDRAVDAVLRQDRDLASAVVAAGDDVEHRCALVHVRVLAALGRRQAPPELQVLAALLHILRGVQAVAMHCTRIARLVPARAFMSSELVTLLERVDDAAAAAVSSLWLAREAFAARDIERAQDAIRTQAELVRRGEAVFRGALDVTDVYERRAGTITALLAMSYVESIGSIAADIAEQTVIVVNGLFREVADVAPWMQSATAIDAR